MLKKLPLAAFVATLITAPAFADKNDPKFVDESSYAVGVLMGKNIEGVIDSDLPPKS